MCWQLSNSLPFEHNGIASLLFLTERIQQLHITNGQQIIQEPNYHPKRKQLAPSPSPQREQEDKEYEELEEEEYEDEEKANYTSSTTPHSRCPRGVSTDELEDHETQLPPPQPKKNPTDHQYTLIYSSYISDKGNQISNNNNNSSKRFQDNPVGGNQSKRFEGGDTVVNQSSSSSNNNSKRSKMGTQLGTSQRRLGTPSCSNSLRVVALINQRVDRV